MEKPEKQPVKLIADQPMKKTVNDTYTAASIEANIKKAKSPVAIASTRG